MPDNICPRCSTPIPTGSDVDESGVPGPGVQCPRCLLRPPWDKPHPVAITLGPGQSFIPPSIEELSQHIVGYDVQARIGQGGMGAVYLGRQKSLDRAVAIKILPPQIAERAGFRERFAQEGRALAKLNHPNIVAVHDFGQAGPYAMLVMELVEGANLREVLAQGKLSPAEALEIIPQLCDALSYAHEEGVVHRDIKPENLLFDSRGRLKITDFGLAKLLATRSAAESADLAPDDEAASVPDPTQGVVGTVHYMAPEQLENPRSVDHRADIYAMGVVFYEMLTGELPIGRFEPPSHLVGQDVSDQPARYTIDVRLDEVVLRALEKHPEKRYGSASAVMHDIDEIESTPNASASARILPEGHRHRVRDTIHQAGEAASSFAAASYDATGQWVSSARKSWLRNPRVEVPAYWAVGSIAVGILFAIFFGTAPRGEAMAFLCMLIAVVMSVVFARISLSRESESDDQDGNLATRFILAIVYLMFAVPIVFAPMFGTFAIWSEIHDFPRDVGRTGWLRDWVQILSITTVVTSCSWLLLLGFHLIVPSVLSTVFKPFVGPMTRRVAVPLIILFAVLMGVGIVAYRQMPYGTYLPGREVPEENWEQLSPRDFKEMQNEMQERERELAKSQVE